jgi:hypothetical protein
LETIVGNKEIPNVDQLKWNQFSLFDEKRPMDICLLTDHRYLRPVEGNAYIANILEEDRLLTEALQDLGFEVGRTNWDNPEIDWRSVPFLVFRTTWDYFERIGDFRDWMDQTAGKTKFVNSAELVSWNLDKHYLADLDGEGVRIPQTVFLEKGENRSLKELCTSLGWDSYVLKPAVSGAARHTYKFENPDSRLENLFSALIREESMLLQPFFSSISERGEASLMWFGGTYSHSVLKMAQPNDFRVQDDFGGTLHPFLPDADTLELAEKALSACPVMPVYARVDVMWDKEGRPCVSELELIEPELWMRRHPPAALHFARALEAAIRS